MCLEREPGRNHAVAVTSELDPAGLPLTGRLLALSSISAFGLIAAFAATYSVSKVGGSWGGSLRSGWRRNPLAFAAARAHSTITSARSATRAEPDEVAAERSSKKRLTRV